MKPPASHSAGLTPEQWQAYLENRLSPDERVRIEAMLQASEDDRDALEGLRALGAEAAGTLVADLHQDIDILTAPDRGKRGTGVVRRLGYVRMGVAAAVLVLFGAGFWMLSLLQEQKTDRQAFDRHFEPIAPQQLGQTEGQTEGGAFTEQLVPGQESPSPEPKQDPATRNATPVHAEGSFQKAEMEMDRPATEDVQENTGEFHNLASGSDLTFAFEPTEESILVQESGNIQSFDLANEAAKGLDDQTMPDVMLSRPQVSSQAAPKALVLEDSRKKENPVSIRGSRNIPAQSADVPAGATGQAPASAPTSSEDQEMDNLQLPLADDPSTEMGNSRQESLSEVVVSKSANRGYKPAPDPYEQGQRAYADGDYRMAIEWLSKVPAGHPQAHAADLLEANAWLERDKPEKAIPLLEGLKAQGPGLLYDQCRWYLALAHIAQGNEDPAIALLEALVLENGPYRARALELLSDLSD
ncbi:MAG: hypothetical protein GC205_06335 [Bacteroidetes bacterium]|nr:hypothetical protein [Bacteroidota bacterium]